MKTSQYSAQNDIKEVFEVVLSLNLNSKMFWWLIWKRLWHKFFEDRVLWFNRRLSRWKVYRYFVTGFFIFKGIGTSKICLFKMLNTISFCCNSLQQTTKKYCLIAINPILEPLYDTEYLYEKKNYKVSIKQQHSIFK